MVALPVLNRFMRTSGLNRFNAETKDAEAKAEMRQQQRTWTALLASAALALPLVGIPALAAPDPETGPWKYDFGTATSPVAEGWVGVSESNRYSEEAGYGIDPASPSAPVSRDRSTGDDVQRDFVLSTSWGFLLDVPSGTYDVTVTSGDMTGT
ncbi:MAG: hypothetical protein J0H73_00765, partial [Salana multivorans]|nr:hypothetical protein [Salana multivorans]